MATATRVLDPDKSPAFGTVFAIPWTLIDPDPHQPRNTDMSDRDYAGYIRELADSIRDNGQLQPIAIRVSPIGIGRYVIIAGESRWRAVQVIPQDTVDAILYDVTTKERQIDHKHTARSPREPHTHTDHRRDALR